MTELIEQSRFRDWLNNHDPNDVVGFKGEPEFCPMAAYLRENGYTDAVVGMIRWSSNGVYDQKYPYWVERFIYHADGEGCNEDDSITASEAVICLNIAEGERMERESSPVDQTEES